MENNNNSSLGGRLSLLQPGNLSEEQRTFYDHLQETEIKWSQKTGFQAETEGKALIGPFNGMLRSPLIGRSIIDLTTTISKQSSLNAKVKQVIILTVGAVWQADYEIYAHIAVAKDAGLPDEVVKSVASGLSHSGLTEEEEVARSFTYALATTHRVTGEVYNKAVEKWGEKGVFDLIALAGQYMTISSLLNAFEVPAPQENDLVPFKRHVGLDASLERLMRRKKMRMVKQGAFWVTGERLPLNGLTYQRAPMFVSWEAPQHITKPYPIVLVHGGALQSTEWFDTPDGRPGWAQRLVEAGYVVFSVDRPGHGRSPFQTDVIGEMGPSFAYEEGKEVFFSDASKSKHTKWPIETGNDDAVDAFIAPFGPLPANLSVSQQMDADRLASLLEKIGPAIIITHSASGSVGWLLADRKPDQVVAIVTVEPMGPPFSTTPNIGELTWGLTAAPITYKPQKESPEGLKSTDPSTLKIPALANIPVAVVSGEVSVQAKYAPEMAAFLKAVGADAESLHLPDHGIYGNGHGLIYETNSDESLGVVLNWLDKKANGKNAGVPKPAEEGTMLFVTYEGDASSRFDRQYYLEHHMPLVSEAWKPYGLLNATALFESTGASGVLVVCVCQFKNEGSINAALSAKQTDQVMSDVTNFTDIKPKQTRSLVTT